MIIVSYDISNTKLRTRFSKMLLKNGGIRLHEFNNTKRILDILKVKVETIFAKEFDGGDSIFIFETDMKTAVKYGNAIHRDTDILYF